MTCRPPLRLPRRANPAQSGLTLIEMMVAMTLGSAIALTCCALFLMARHANQQIAESVQLQEASRLALELMARVIRQANAGGSGAPAIQGRDNARFTSGLLAHTDINHSDIISVRQMGSGTPADGTVRNCGGGTIDAGTRSSSIFYLAPGADGNPELTCRYDGKTVRDPVVSLVPAIESLQFLYAIDGNGDGIPDQMLNAAAMSDAQWRQVVAVRIAILVRTSDMDHLGSRPAIVYHLFGPAYSALREAADPGVRFEPGVASRGYIRKVFNTTVWLRQPPS